MKGAPPPTVSMNNSRESLTVRLEKAMLVSVALPRRPFHDDPLDELRGLAETAGAVVVGGLTQKRGDVVPATYIGKGKLAELTEQAQAVDADVILFDNDLSPAQVRNIETATGIKVLDRSELILDIFATRARSQEASSRSSWPSWSTPYRGCERCGPTCRATKAASACAALAKRSSKKIAASSV